jgi:hypothetical protein
MVRYETQIALHSLQQVAGPQMVADRRIVTQGLHSSRICVRLDPQPNEVSPLQDESDCPCTRRRQPSQNVKATMLGKHFECIRGEIMDMCEMELPSRSRVRSAQVGAFHVQEAVVAE